MTDDSSTLYADLAEEVYQRNALDIPLSFKEINDLNGSSVQAAGFLNPTNLNSIGLVGNFTANNGMVYSISGDGFAAQVLQNGSQFIVVFRGTDLVNLTTNDFGDLSADGSLAAGSQTANQITEMHQLMQMVIAKAGGTANVTVVGQSLGGGLAILAGAEYGVQTYAFDPAPFAAQLWTDAITSALNSSLLIPSGVSIQAQIAAHHANTAAIYASSSSLSSVLNALPSYISQADAAAFGSELSVIYNGYLANLSGVTAARVTNEVLSDPNDWLGMTITAVSTPFDSPNLGAPLGETFTNPLEILPYNIGVTPSGFLEAIALHHPSLIALLTVHPDFATLTANDAAIVDALFNDTAISGPVSHPRADPQNINTVSNQPVKITSYLPGGFADPSVLLRALNLSSDLYNNFTQEFGTQIDSGVAGTGLNASTFNANTIHAALVEIGLEIVRDNLGTEDPASGIYTPTQIALQPFGNIASQNYAIAHLNNITDGAAPGVAPSPLLSTTSQYGTGPVPFGVNQLDTIFINDFTAAANNPNGVDVSTLDHAITAWQILVVQAGAGVMSYTPNTNVDLTNSSSVAPDSETSHLIFGGNSSGPGSHSTITGSTAMNFIVGGTTPTTFNLGQGISGIEDGIGSYVIGGSGQDTADFFNSDVAINETPSDTANSLAASANAWGARHDVLINIHTIVAPVKAGLLNTINFAYDTSGLLDTVTTNGGANVVVASNVSPLNFIGAGGVNVLDLLSSHNTYQISASGDEVDLTSSTGVVDHTIGVQDFEFGDQTFYTASELGAHDTTMALGVFSGQISMRSNPSATTNGGQLLFQDSIAGLSDSIDIEHFGNMSPVGALAANLFQSADELNSEGDPANNVGGINLAYTLNAQALLTAPKGFFDDDFTVAISDGFGSSVTSDVIVAVQGLGQTTHITSTSFPSPIVEDTTSLVASQTTTGTFSFTDSDTEDRHIVEVTYLGSTIQTNPNNATSTNITQLGNLEAIVTQDTTGAGSGGVVNLNYVINEAMIQAIPEGKTITETYSVTVDDGLGGTAGEYVPIVITATPNETTITSSQPPVSQLHQNATASGIETASGTIFFSDSDTIDAHSIAQQLAADDSVSGDPGSFSAMLVTDTTGTGTGGEIDWTYTVSDAALSALPTANKDYGEIYGITLSDGRGGTEGLSETIDVFGTPTAPPTNPNAPPTIGLLALSFGRVTNTGVTLPHGSMSFTDTNTSDTDVVSAQFVSASNGATAPIGQLIQTVSPTNPHSYTEQYALTLAERAETPIAGLTDGQSYSEIWQVSVNASNGEIATKNTTIVFDRINETIIINGTTNTGAVGAENAPSTSGVIDFSDTNLDSHIVSTPVLVSSTNGSAPIGTMLASLSIDTLTTANAGQINWDYSATSANLDDLSENQVVKETWAINISDGHGGTTTDNVIITITGPNDEPPVITSNPTVPEFGALVADAVFPATNETASGHITFADVDLGDAHTTSFRLDPNANPLFSQGTFTAVVDQDTTGTGTGGDVAWTYNISNAALSALQDGQTLTGAYTVTIADGHGGTASQIVDVTLSRPADQTIFTSAAVTADVTEGTAAPATTETATGVITFNDSDLRDTHAVTVSFVPDSANDAQLGTLTASLTSDDAGTATDGIINWNYAVNDTALANLAPGTTQTETYAVNVSDGHGGTVTQDVTIDLHAPAAPPAPTDLEFVGHTSVAFDDAESETSYAIGQLATIDANPDAQLTYSLVGNSASDFSIDQQGNLTLLDNSALDFSSWHTAVEAAFGGNLTDAQIDAKFANGFLDNPADAAAVAQLTTEFSGTPYEVQIQAADANGQSITKTAFIDVHDQANDYTNFSLQSVGSVSELAPVGTVVATLDGIVPNEPYGMPYFQDPSGHFVEVGNVIETARPLDYAVQSEYDFTLSVSTPPTADQPYWSGTNYDLPLQVTSANIQPGNPSDWAYTPIVTETIENPTADVLIGNLTIPAGTNVTVMVDGASDAYGQVPSDSFQVRHNSDGTESLWLVGGDYLNREALGPSGILNLTLDAYTTDGTTTTEVQIPVNLKVDDVYIAPSVYAQSGQLTAGIMPYDQPASSWNSPSVIVQNLDYYDDIYTTRLVAGADDSDLFSIVSQSSNIPISTTDYIVPNGVLADRSYLVDVETTGPHSYDTITQVTINTTPADPTLDGYQVLPNSPNGIGVTLGQSAGGTEDTQYDVLLGGYDDPTNPGATMVSVTRDDSTHYGNLAATFVAATANEAAHIHLDFSVADADVPYLQAGYGMGESYTVTVNDNGVISQLDESVFIAGSPQATIGIVSASVPDDIVADASAPATSESTAGNIAFSDTNLSNNHTVSVHLDPSADPVFSQGVFSALVDQDTTGTGTGGDVAWTYNIPDAALSTLQGGQTLTGAYTITINDGNGEPAPQIVDVTVTGVNTPPVIASGGTTTASLAVDPTHVAGDHELAAGTMNFSDANWDDAHIVSATFVSTDGATSAPLGNFTDNLVADTAHTGGLGVAGTGGQIGWNYDVSDAALATIAAGTVVHETFDVAVTDDHGATAHQQVILNLSHLPIAA
jgi:VCBS repeat-containing protein